MLVNQAIYNTLIFKNKRMDNNELLMKLVEKLLDWDNTQTIEKKEETDSIFIWKYVILRARNAWVHFWKLEYANNWVYRLSESRRLYRWRVKGKNWISLSELATYWLDTEYSKVCVPIKLIEITEREWAEIIPIEETVCDSFKNIITYNPN